jgi:PAS domain S-box-containing protein
VSVPPPSRTIPWHARLEASLLIAVTFVVAESLVAVLLATTKVVAYYSQTQSAEDLVAARAAFDRLTETRRQAASRTTRLIVELPTFRDLIADPIASADTPTLDHTTQQYCDKLGAQFCVVTNAAGDWIGRAGTALPAEAQATMSASTREAASGRSSDTMAVVGGRLFLLVAEPAMFGTMDVIGTFTAGFALDDAVATELAAITNSDVSFLCPAICGSSLSVNARRELTGLIDSQPEALSTTNRAPALHQIGPATYVGARYSLDAVEGQHVSLVLLKDWAATAQALQAIDRSLGWVAGLTLVVSVIGTVVYSRRLTRPLRDLAAATDEIAGGRRTTRVPSKGPVEVRHLAAAFNRMADGLDHWRDAVEARSAELNVSYRRFRAITDSASDAIVSIDACGRIVFWNPRAAAVFGYSDVEVLGEDLTMLVPEELRDECAAALDRLVAGETTWLGRAFESVAQCCDGSRVPVEISVSRWSNDAEVFHTGIIRDMTERQQAAEALKQREDQLRQAQKMEAVGRLAGGVAHDFNNLLTAILGYADLLLEQLPEGDSVRPRVLEIQKAGRTAASLTRDLLAFSRKQVLQPVVLDLNAVIRNTESLITRLVGEDVKVTVSLDSAMGSVRADPGQISQVLLNLAVNARDAMPDGGQLTISTQHVPGDGPTGEALLTVADTGRGMTESVRARIFEPFFTTKAVGHGTGLGLATVYGIVQQSEGRIWVESTPGEGTTFSVAFPIVEGRPSMEQPAEVRDEAIRAPSEAVLLVEDNDVVRSMARDALTADGYRVVEASNGAEALRAAGHNLSEIAVVVTDVVMPVMGGRELVLQLRAMRPELKVIFTSGYASDPNTAQHARAAGAVFIQKPFVPSLLRRTVREVLDGRVA